jgi:hypothetical protein
MAWKQDFAKSLHIIKITSYIRIEKSPFSGWREKKTPTAELTLQEATESSKLGKTKTNKKPCGMNKSASLTLVQGPSTVVCMMT